MKSTFFTLIIAVTCFACTPTPPPGAAYVVIVGQMKDVMWKGELFGKIDLDTIANKQHLYGLGPLEGLAGEILVFEGKSYLSSVLADSSILVEESFLAKAPFFAYANIEHWQEHAMPNSVQSMHELELYLDDLLGSQTAPSFFKLSAKVEEANIHIVNLPKGRTISSPEEVHEEKQGYILQDQACEILGFYSTQHQSIFTHHDTHLHMHLITADKQKMGHVDDIRFQKGTLKLYLPMDG